MGETGPTCGVCEVTPVVRGDDRLMAAMDGVLPAHATEQDTSMSGAPPPDNKILIWAPALATEPKEMLVEWAQNTSRLMLGMQVVMVLNGPGSERASHEIRRSIPPSVHVYALPGPASIGKAQQFMMHRFLQSDAQVLVRIDPDNQFSLGSLARLCGSLVPGGPDVVVGQRDEASVSGRIRFLGNVILRFVAVQMGLVADPNSGCYAMGRRAAAAFSQLPLPKYPEPRMLACHRSMSSLHVASFVVPTLPRRSGASSITGMWRGAAIFAASFLELLSCDRL